MRSLMKLELERQVDAHPGAVELVNRLRELDGVAVGLASNSSRDLVDVALRVAGLTGAFDAIVTSDDVSNAKPAPDIYLLSCQRLGVEPSEALALEDTAPGIAAAKAAGLTCIAVPQFAETDVSAADRVVESLEELLAPS
jgi:HAD superfamily hydrolase (TIGR01509 family)